MDTSPHRSTVGISSAAFIAAMVLATMPSASRAADFEEEVVAEAAASMVEWKADTNNGSVQLPLSKQREAILRFDVNGMANATNVVARFYCSAHLASAATPVVLRVMRDVDWNPSSATPNNMKHEIPFFPSTWIGRGDPLFARACPSRRPMGRFRALAGDSRPHRDN